MINHYCGNEKPNTTAAYQMVRYHLGSIGYAAVWFPIAEIFRKIHTLFSPCIDTNSKPKLKMMN
jgi:hypothetical protein